MDVILISEREGMRKPEPEIFARALRALHVPADDAWFVGDHPVVDVAGAAAAGLSAIWRRCSYWPTPTGPHRVIERLDDVLSLLGDE